jgi:Zn-finger nucleic acid-binding protein
MTEVPLSNSSGIRVDVCRICQFIWFDIRENDALIPRPVPEPPPVLTERAMELMAMARVDQINRERGEKSKADRWRAILLACIPSSSDTSEK